MPVSTARKLCAEGIGAALLLVAVVGSGIMAERLAGGNAALALLFNAIATGCALVVLITIFAPLSCAHFNPAVTLYFTLRGEMTARAAALYAAVQIPAAIMGVWLTHAMFETPIWEISTHLRGGAAQGLSELIATLGLLATIIGARATAPAATPMLVGLYITGAYGFTASTSFANPAVTIARALTDSFSGIAPGSVPMFILAQLAATMVAAFFLPRLFGLAR
jgi:glycerol uptake facilitator-like aquaporin